MRFPRGLAVLLAACLALCLFPYGSPAQQSGTQEPQSQEPRYTRQIILIIIDGLQAEALQKVQAPNMNGVASAGVRIDDCLPVWPYGLETSVASILTGTDPQAHGFVRAGDKLKQLTIFELIKKNRLQSGFYDASARLDGLAAGADHHLKADDDEKLVEAALQEMMREKPYFNVLVLADARRALNDSGLRSQEYYRAVSNADNQVGRVLHFLHQQGIYEQTLIAITGTDGEPPLIIKGMQFKGGVILPPVAQVDIAPTLAYILNVEIPASTGLVLWNAFEPGSLKNGFYLMEQRIRELSKARAEAVRAIHRLYEEQRQVRAEKQVLTAREAEIKQAIQERDEEIARLGQTVSFLKYLIGGLVVLFGLGYLVEYRVLRKRFLMF